MGVLHLLSLLLHLLSLPFTGWLQAVNVLFLFFLEFYTFSLSFYTFSLSLLQVVNAQVTR